MLPCICHLTRISVLLFAVYIFTLNVITATMMNFLKANARRSLFRQYKGADNAGVSMPELMAVVAITGVLAAIAAPSISFGNEPLKDTTKRVAANIKLIRAKAMSQTSAYRIRAISDDQLIIERANSCDAPDAEWTRDPGFAEEDLRLDEEVSILSAKEDSVEQSNWDICFNSRGIADKNLTLVFAEAGETTQEQIEIFQGGNVAVSKYAASVASSETGTSTGGGTSTDGGTST
ncbi:MAG: prepilin-type N-terminal cleavage/methylation domain-containing protein, partial [Thermosynechococcaceae cyanobacterium]